ncbi:MAG: hypothetical protein RR495_04065 [Anaerovoracaceae bacterium]
MKRLTRIFTVLIIISVIVTSFGLANVDFSYAAAPKVTIKTTKVLADARVVNAYEELGFKTKVDKSLSYAGVFSVSKHAIIVKSPKQEYVLHEMGHFLAELTYSSDDAKEFIAIYIKEKNEYKGMLESYIRGSNKEYFAQSFAEYTMSPSKLKQSRPETYNYIKTKINSISKVHIEDMQNSYGWAW